MTELEELEQHFWSKVWRCTHRQPCKKCCWPWKSIDLTENWKCIWQQHATFCHRSFPGGAPRPAHRVALELCHGIVLRSGHTFHVCHQCHFGPCCNPSHLVTGSASDNARDRHRIRYRQQTRPAIRLPDGRRWDYEEACIRQAAFEEALGYLRVWAGFIPKKLTKEEAQLSEQPSERGLWLGKRIPIPPKPFGNPGKPTLFLYSCHKEGEQKPERVSKEKVLTIQQDLETVARRHKVSLTFLCRLASLDVEQAWAPVKVS